MSADDPADMFRQIALGASLIGLTTLLAFGAAAQPRDGEAVVVIFAPWTNETERARSVWQAGGYLLGEGRVPGAVVTRSNDSDASGFPSRLRSGGAWLVLNGGLSGLLCRPVVGALHQKLTYYGMEYVET